MIKEETARAQPATRASTCEWRQQKTNRDTGDAWLFQYDALRNLLTVGLPNGDLVEYLVDGMGRRVGKKKNGVLLKQWIYRDALKPVAELDGAGALVSEFVYGSKSNVPDYVRRGGATYRVISDQLGSPRYVVNVANAGDVPFTATYTSFGVVTGTGLDWMQFGFAGGTYDGDTGVTRFGKRDFDAAIGRWTAKEPLRFSAGHNFYVYAGEDPVNFVDTTGTVAVADDVVIAGGAAILFGGVALYAVLSGNHAALDRLVHAVEHALPDSVCPIRGEGKELDRIAKDLGIDRDELRKAIEKIKHAGGLGGSDNVDILPDGTVVDPVSGDPIGNVYDEQGD